MEKRFFRGELDWITSIRLRLRTLVLVGINVIVVLL